MRLLVSFFHLSPVFYCFERYNLYLNRRFSIVTEKVIDIKFKRVCIKSPQRNSRFGIAVVNLTLFDLKVDWLILLVSFSQFVPLYIDCSVSIWIEN